MLPHPVPLPVLFPCGAPKELRAPSASQAHPGFFRCLSLLGSPRAWDEAPLVWRSKSTVGTPWPSMELPESRTFGTR